MAFSVLISVRPISRNWSSLMTKQSENCSRERRTGSAEPNRRRITSSSPSNSGMLLISRQRLRASIVRSLPLRLLPGRIGFCVIGSRTTGLSTAPIAENAPEAPMCMPVRTFNSQRITIFPYISYPCLPNSGDTLPALPCSVQNGSFLPCCRRRLSDIPAVWPARQNPSRRVRVPRHKPCAPADA